MIQIHGTKYNLNFHSPVPRSSGSSFLWCTEYFIFVGTSQNLNSFKLLSTQLISDWKSGPVSVFTLKSLRQRPRLVLLKFLASLKTRLRPQKTDFVVFCGLNPPLYTRYVTNNIFYYYNSYFHILSKALECSCTSNSPNKYIRLHHMWWKVLKNKIYLKEHVTTHISQHILYVINTTKLSWPILVI